MICRVVKAEEYYGRDISYLDKLVLMCNECGYIGTYDNIEEAEKSREDHQRSHDK